MIARIKHDGRPSRAYALQAVNDTTGTWKLGLRDIDAAREPPVLSVRSGLTKNPAVRRLIYRSASWRMRSTRRNRTCRALNNTGLR